MIYGLERWNNKSVQYLLQVNNFKILIGVSALSELELSLLMNRFVIHL